jgi:hypothetical protein
MSSTRVRSLWEMRSREAESFIRAIASCERIHVLVEYGAKGTDVDLSEPIHEDVKTRSSEHFNELNDAIDGMGCKATLRAIRRGIKMMEDGLNYRQLGEANKDIFSRFKDEMEGRYILFMDEHEFKYFSPEKPLFGELVADRLPDCSFDIEEAGKCCAVARYTACVFHLMRAAEGASAAVGRQLPLGILTANIDAKIAAMPKGPKKDDWLKVPYVLHACNRAYRTKTAHPADVYTGEQAERALQATRALLQEFAELLPDPVEQLIG